jgi:transcriptional regulator with XRE-family HTH domain
LQLTSVRPTHIGKEVDRLEEDGDFSLEAAGPQHYGPGDHSVWEQAMAALGSRPQSEVAAQLGISIRRLRDILKGRARPRGSTAQRILALAARIPEADVGGSPGTA